MWYKNVGISFFHLVTMHAFDRQRDGRRTAEIKALKYKCNKIWQKSRQT